MAELGIPKTFGSHPFLSGLADQHLMLLASGASPFAAEPDEFLGRAGEPAHALYLIQSGCVTIGVHKPDSEITPLRTAGRAKQSAGPGWCRPTRGTLISVPWIEFKVCYSIPPGYESNVSNATNWAITS